MSLSTKASSCIAHDHNVIKIAAIEFDLLPEEPSFLVKGSTTLDPNYWVSSHSISTPQLSTMQQGHFQVCIAANSIVYVEKVCACVCSPRTAGEVGLQL